MNYDFIQSMGGTNRNDLEK